MNPAQRAESAYAQKFREGSSDDPDIFFGRPMTPETLAGWVRDPAAKTRYIAAFKRSSFDAMLHSITNATIRPCRNPDS